MAVDDAYSRYVMTLDPTMFLRMRDVTAGGVWATNEVGGGPGRTEWNAKRFYYQGPAAGAILTGSLLPSGATAKIFNPVTVSNNNIVLGGGDWWDSITNYTPPYAHKADFHNGFSINFWYRNTVNHGAVNHRLFCSNVAEALQLPHLSLFSWNSSDNMLVELLFKRRNDILGTSAWVNRGNNENYRYLSAKAANAINTVNMYTFTLTEDTMALYKNGDYQSSYTWDKSTYRPMLASSSWWLGGYAAFGQYGDFDKALCQWGEMSMHSRALTGLEVAELYAVGLTGLHTRAITGTVTDILGAGLSRLVRAHAQTDGRLLAETTSAGDGTFTLKTPAPYVGAIYVVAFDDLGIAPDYNAAITSNVVAQ